MSTFKRIIEKDKDGNPIEKFFFDEKEVSEKAWYALYESEFDIPNVPIHTKYNNYSQEEYAEMLLDEDDEISEEFSVGYAYGKADALNTMNQQLLGIILHLKKN